MKLHRENIPDGAYTLPQNESLRSQALEAGRLRLLLGILANAECERQNLVSGPQERLEIARWHRCRYDLLWREDFERFLESSEMSETEFMQHMATVSHIAVAKRYHRERIDGLLPRLKAICSAPDWVLRRESQSPRSDHE